MHKACMYLTPAHDSSEPLPILVIVDMQPKFTASNNPALLTAIAQQIELAMRNSFTIIVLEYGDLEAGKNPQSLRCGDTHEQLMRPMLFPCRYSQLVTAEKLGNDGSALVLHACAVRCLTNPIFRVCGVNTDACVSATVFGLAVRRPKSRVEVIVNACNTETANFSWERDFPRLPNITLESDTKAA